MLIQGLELGRGTSAPEQKHATTKINAALNIRRGQNQKVVCNYGKRSVGGKTKNGLPLQQKRCGAKLRAMRWSEQAPQWKPTRCEGASPGRAFLTTRCPLLRPKRCEAATHRTCPGFKSRWGRQHDLLLPRLGKPRLASNAAPLARRNVLQHRPVSALRHATGGQR